jgi:Leucine-rich repeat (LRR) protein
VEITWEREFLGQVLTTEMTEIDLSQVKITDLDRLEAEMAYFPDAETVFLGETKLSNDDLAERREKLRDQYKLVWTVTCGKKMKARTDDTTFMPVRERVYYFNDEEAYNLRYCEDMVCIDIGHMSISNIDFVKYMPNLEFLILAHTQVQYVEPIRTCKNLKFLELDWSPIRDLSPLVDCTALEDLNLGNTFCDVTPILGMNWLKNVYFIDGSPASAYKFQQANPEAHVVATGNATVGGGWRRLQNYYDMRDCLHAPYMN